jgi:hypothetical protein
MRDAIHAVTVALPHDLDVLPVRVPADAVSSTIGKPSEADN